MTTSATVWVAVAGWALGSLLCYETWASWRFRRWWVAALVAGTWPAWVAIALLIHGLGLLFDMVTDPAE